MLCKKTTRKTQKVCTKQAFDPRARIGPNRWIV